MDFVDLMVFLSDILKTAIITSLQQSTEKNAIKRDSCSRLGYVNLDYFIISQLYFNNLPM
jgi:Na+/glutamate symporter